MASVQPLIVDGTPDQVQQRIQERLVTIRNLWLPTRAELKRWDRSGAPLYVSWGRGGAFEIGPRLETVPAARFAPVFQGHLQVEGTGRTRVSWRVAWPRTTLWVLIGFTAAAGLWGTATFYNLSQGLTHWGWVGAWAALVLTVHGGAAIAWRWGRGELLKEQGWLQEVLRHPRSADEDW